MGRSATMSCFLFDVVIAHKYFVQYRQDVVMIVFAWSFVCPVICKKTSLVFSAILLFSLTAALFGLLRFVLGYMWYYQLA